MNKKYCQMKMNKGCKIKKYLANIILLVIICGLLEISAVGQPSLPISLRSAIYRIEIPGIKYGTATCFRKDNNYFLITNKHVVTLNSGQISDSIFLYRNRVTNFGEVLSGPEKFTVPLRLHDSILYYIGEMPNLDLVLISIGKRSSIDSINFINATVIPDSTDLKKILMVDQVCTAIGYPSKSIDNLDCPLSPEYRWGRYSDTQDGLLHIKMPVIKGNSGSPILAETNRGYYFVGIAVRGKDDDCLAIPSSMIKPAFSKYFSKMEQQQNNNR
jgi:hypothetical protein